MDEPLLAHLVGGARLPCANTLSRGLTRFPAKAVRAAVEAAYQAELPRRAGRVWAALDAPQVPYWGRGKTRRFAKGWSGSHGRSLRGYRLFRAVDTATGQIITFLQALAADGSMLGAACTAPWALLRSDWTVGMGVGTAKMTVAASIASNLVSARVSSRQLTASLASQPAAPAFHVRRLMP